MNGKRVIWDFPAGQCELFVHQHLFYVKEAKCRVINQFSSIDKEASEVRDKTLERLSSSFDPERHDEAAFYEMAENRAQAQWEALHELKNSMILGVAAGMFHQFEKVIRQKLVDELGHYFEPEEVKKSVWGTNHGQVMDELSYIASEIKAQDFVAQIDLLRLVVNVYKHGEGPAHTKLAKTHPEFYLHHSISKAFDISPSYEDLALPVEQLDKFAEAIKEFWEFLPENVCEGDLKSDSD